MAVHVDDQQLFYVAENVNTGEAAGPDNASQIFYLTESAQTLPHATSLDTLRENQHIIMENQSKIMVALAKIQTNQDYAMTHCRCHAVVKGTVLPEVSPKEPVQSVLTPVDSKEELDALERSLEDTKLMQQFAHGMNFICGITGKSQGVDCCYRLIDHFFTRQLLTQCSWTGMVRLKDANSQQEPSGSVDTGAKIPLKFYKNIRALFLSLIRQADKDFSELECEKFFKTILKNSKQRLSVRVLTSKHKNRPINLKYNKSGVESGTTDTSTRSDENCVSSENTTEPQML